MKSPFEKRLAVLAEASGGLAMPFAKMLPKPASTQRHDLVGDLENDADRQRWVTLRSAVRWNGIGKPGWSTLI